MQDLPLKEPVSGTFTAAGSLTLSFAVPSFEVWAVEAVGVFTSDPLTATTIPVADLYMDAVAPTSWIGGTYSGNRDVYDTGARPLTLERNQRLYCVWTGGTAGNTGTLVVRGRRFSGG